MKRTARNHMLETGHPKGFRKAAHEPRVESAAPKILSSEEKRKLHDGLLGAARKKDAENVIRLLKAGADIAAMPEWVPARIGIRIEEMLKQAGIVSTQEVEIRVFRQKLYEVGFNSVDRNVNGHYDHIQRSECSHVKLLTSLPQHGVPWRLTEKQMISLGAIALYQIIFEGLCGCYVGYDYFERAKRIDVLTEIAEGHFWKSPLPVLPTIKDLAAEALRLLYPSVHLSR